MVTRITDMDGNASGFDSLVRLFAAHRLLIYVGGLVVLGIPLVLSMILGVDVPRTARLVLVGTVLTLMVVTYIGERRMKHDHDADNGDHSDPREQEHEQYPLRMRIAVALAVLGVAVGVYVTIEVNVLTGLLFIVGAYFFGYLGFRGGEGER